MPICHCVIVRKCVRIRMCPKLILGLAINAVGTLASCYVDVLWVNVIAVMVVGVEFWIPGRDLWRHGEEGVRGEVV